MVFEASATLSMKWDPARSSTQQPLSHYDVIILEEQLQADASRCLYSALISIADALRGVESGYYSWSAVKLYYSVFYSLRAALALSNVCIYYQGTSPRWAQIRVGSLPQKPTKTGGNNTHKVVLDLFAVKHEQSVILSQSIEELDPLKWMQKMREKFNYKDAKFCEPSVPECFHRIVRVGVRKSLSAYMADRAYMYAFDRDHAIVAYPLEVLKWLRLQRPCSDWLDEPDLGQVRRFLSDRHGPLTAFDVVLRALPPLTTE
ncbi:MAG: HEPN domain-containing protein [Caenispirillum bisanense]|nr:HEPN domain-containing protein [Caenispirillum bisanense]MCA1971501.1 HEPN domain-containing protein [Caenispirillum sp.]